MSKCNWCTIKTFTICSSSFMPQTWTLHSLNEANWRLCYFKSDKKLLEISKIQGLYSKLGSQKVTIKIRNLWTFFRLTTVENSSPSTEKLYCSLLNLCVQHIEGLCSWLLTTKVLCPSDSYYSFSYTYFIKPFVVRIITDYNSLNL